MKKMFEYFVKKDQGDKGGKIRKKRGIYRYQTKG